MPTAVTPTFASPEEDFSNQPGGHKSSRAGSRSLADSTGTYMVHVRETCATVRESS